MNKKSLAENNIILIGPSGVGKTEWQRAIANGNVGFEGIEIDEQIGGNSKMKQFLENVPGNDEAEKMGNAFGKPWEDPDVYKAREAMYLEAEREEMERLYDKLKGAERRFIADLTGSAIYCREQLSKLLPLGLVVYLSAGEEQHKAMLKNFLLDPKPVCWGSVLNGWKKAVDEGNARNRLEDFFTLLLKIRDQLYRASADVILPWKSHREKAKLEEPQSLLAEINNQLNGL